MPEDDGVYLIRYTFEPGPESTFTRPRCENLQVHPDSPIGVLFNIGHVRVHLTQPNGDVYLYEQLTPADLDMDELELDFT